MQTRTFLNSEEIQREALQILLSFDRICQQHGWAYSLAGGTLLGAVRHKGFIPWDDDIDVSMARPDYEAFLATYRGRIIDGEYAMRGFPRPTESEPLYLKYVTQRVRVRNRFLERDDYLWIDVTPVDGLPVEDGATKRIYERAGRYRRIAELLNADPSQGKTMWHQKVKSAFKAIDSGGRISEAYEERLNRLATAIPYGSTGFVGAITWGIYGVGERMPLSGYEHKTALEFEGHRLPAMSCWKEYLSGLYGDYMKLPPPEKRVHHEMRAWYA